MSTEDGLIEYNGKDFKTYINQSYESEYTNVKQDDKGYIWCQNFSNQVFRLEGEELKLIYSMSPDYLRDSYLAFDVHSYPNLYINTDYGILHYNVETKQERIIGGEEEFNSNRRIANNKKIVLNNKQYANNYLNSLLGRLNDELIFLYALNKQIIYNVKNKQVEEIKYFENELNINTSHIYSSNNTIKYFGNNRLNKKCFYRSSLDRKRINFVDDDLEFASIFQNKNGDFWIGSRDGINIYDSSMHKKDTFLKGYYVSDIIQDNQNNYWISTIKNGVIVIPDFDSQIITAKNSDLSINSIKSIKKLNEKVYLIDNKGTLFESDKGYSFFKPIYNFARLTKIIKNKSLSDELLLLGSDKKIKNNKLEVGYKLFTTKDIGCWDDNTFLISTGNKVFITGNRKNKWIKYFSQYYEGYYRKDFFYDFDELLLVDERRSYANVIVDDKFYVAYSNELRFYDKNQSIAIKHNNIDLVIKHLFKQNEQVFAISSTGEIYSLNEDKTKLLASLSSRVIHAIFEDDRIYLGTNFGAYTYSFKTRKVELIPGSSGYHVNDIMLFENSLTLATTSGLIVVPLKFNNDKISLDLKLKPVIINDKHVIKNDDFELSYKENRIKIEFESYSPKSKEDLIFMYKLEPIDKSWKTTTTFNKEYEALKPGNYKFAVKANGKGNYADSEIKYLKFKINSPFYQKWWFYALISFTTASLMFIFFKFRIKEIKFKNSLMENKIRLEKDLSNSKIQTINAQMNPHFVFNAMNSIQNLILHNNKKEAYSYLNKFSKLLRGILNYGHKDSIIVDDEIRLLENYLALESLRFDHPILVEIVIDEAIKYERIPPMIIQPFVENAVKHGFLSNLIIDKKIRITFKYIDNEVIECSIYDNGVGLMNDSISKNHDSFASEATKNKLKLMRQFYDYTIGLEFVDLTKNHNINYATLVRIKIPIID